MTASIKANVDGSAAIQVGGVDAITLTSAGAASFVTSPMTIQGGSASAPSLTFSGDTNTGIFSPAADTIAFTEGGVESMRIDASGNAGLGVTPSAWFTSNNMRALQLGGGSFASYLNNQVWLTNNYFLNSSGQDTYVNNGTAMRLIMDGAYKFQIAASGTAGNAITFTQAMTLDASGNLGIGTSSISCRLDVQSAGQTQLQIYNTASTADAMTRYRNSLGNYYVGINATGGYLYTGEANPLLFYTNGIERARFAPGGALQLNTTSASEADFKLVSKADRSAHFGDSYDGGYYGTVQISRPASQGTTFHLSLIRVGNAIAGLGFANNSNTFVIANAASNAGNGMTLAVGGTSWGTQSDERKKNILGNIENAIDKVSSLRTVFFEYKNDEAQKRRVGFIAQDVQAVLPEAVHVEDDEDGTLNLQYSDTIPLLVAAIKELKAELDATKAEVALLKGAA